MDRCVSFERLEWMLGSCDPAHREDVSGEPLRRQEYSAVRKAVAQVLTDVQREAVLLYYYRGMTMTQIAQYKGCNKSSVSRTLQRARRNLMRVLQYLPTLSRHSEDENDDSV